MSSSNNNSNMNENDHEYQKQRKKMMDYMHTKKSARSRLEQILYKIERDAENINSELDDLYHEQLLEPYNYSRVKSTEQRLIVLIHEANNINKEYTQNVEELKELSKKELRIHKQKVDDVYFKGIIDRLIIQINETVKQFRIENRRLISSIVNLINIDRKPYERFHIKQIVDRKGHYSQPSRLELLLGIVNNSASKALMKSRAKPKSRHVRSAERTRSKSRSVERTRRRVSPL